MVTHRKLSFFLIVGLMVATVFAVEKAKEPGLNFDIVNWYLSVDGQWVTIIKAINTRSSVNFHTSVGEMYELPVWAFNNSNVVKIITKTPTPITVTARSREGSRTLSLPSPRAVYQNKPLQMTIEAVGPHLVALGFSWLGSENIEQYQIWRQDGTNTPKLVGFVNATSTCFQDNAVKPSTFYKYRLIAMMNGKPLKQVTLSINTPPMMISKSLEALRGKGVIIYIDPDDTKSAFYFKKLTPEEIIDDSKKLGFNYIQLRTVYGTYSHFNRPDIQQWLRQLLELAGKNHIAMLAWSIPRRDSTHAIAEDIAVARTVSASGYTFAGCSLDLETGKDYMGNLPQARDEIANYTRTFRKAVGPNYLVSAIVFTPWQSGYTNANYPFKELAENADVLQPMVFWHHFFEAARHVYSSNEVTQAVANSVILIKQLAGKDIPVNVIGQAVDLGNTGAPAREEIQIALQAANSVRALGVSFFAWNNNLVPEGSGSSELAEAIQNFKW